MKILKDTVRPDLARIKRELEALKGMSVHVGIVGDVGSTELMIARVHEYGMTIHAKNVDHLAIPLTMEAKNAGTPRKFNNLKYIPIKPDYGFLVRDKKRHIPPPPKMQEAHEQEEPSKRRPRKKDPRPNEDYEWMFMLVKSVHIPERSFIRASYDTGKPGLEETCRGAVDNIIRKGWTARQALEYIGAWAEDMTRDYFNTKLQPPKSATTQLTSTQYQPLYDTGRLYGIIKHKVYP